MTDDELDDVTAPLPIAQARRVLSAVGDPTTLVPGAMVAGRYRLITFYGACRHVQFWQGIDFVTGTAVGLSLVDVEGQLNASQVDVILSLTMRLRGLDVVGVARILHVMHTGSFGLVASEWVHGGSLREVADTSPSPTAAAMALKSLIVAADAAHRAGLRLSIDHPGRIRISTEGNAVLAFPTCLPEATVRDDLRGIGGALYALLVDRWLADDPIPAGWVAADLDEAGWPKEPAAVDRRVPFLLSSAAAGLVRPDNGVDSAAELLGLLRLALGEVNTADSQRDSSAEVMPPVTAPAPGGYADFRNVDPTDKARRARKQLVQAMLIAAAVIIVAGVAMLGSTLNDVFSGDNTAAFDAQRLGLNPDIPAAPAPSPVAPPPQAAAPLIPVSASVFSPDGRPDNPDDAAKVIDGDPGTAWATDRYFDADPFPKFKEGLGLLVKLPQPTALDAVTVDLRSSGTVIQIRGASGDPATLADTVELSAPTPMQPGTNRIALTNRTPTPNLLVWIATLGSTDGASRAEISEISLSPTGRA
ncbi:hypothetical protein CQY20_26085 [Mycolicibacterium agri]|uniref:Peptidoglycan biosynthesis protein MviN n=1 Tax=Mycolicibacterium agri TaxID=36811 RepID=A0A2A7MS67_MYCAG|nr:protein kinase family protein [Mycolicibacterium agri]PEG34343.1 hypothetical protein CQY20_26085 [Mycolicibacterium agri]GFG49437.1 hypothetical protein MAGR_08780 [Mycolicibacterium agri]